MPTTRSAPPRPAIGDPRRALAAGLLGAMAIAVTIPTAADGATRIVHLCGPNLCATDPDRGTTTQVTRDGTDEQPYRAPQLSRDGRTLVALHGGQIVRGPWGGALRPAAEAPSGAVDLAITPDAAATAVVTYRQVGRHEPRCYWTLGGMQCDYLNWVVREYDDVVYPADTRHTNATGAALFADGRLLSSRELRGEDDQRRNVLCLHANAADPEGLCAREVQEPGRILSQPAISPDQTLVLATSAPGSADDDPALPPVVGLYNLATGAKLRDVAADANQATFSPDGRQIVFVGGDGRMHVVPTAGGASRALAEGAQPTWAQAPDVVAPTGRVSSSTLRLRGGRIAVRVACPRGGDPCRGTLSLRRGATVLGTRAYRIAPGRSLAVAVGTTARARTVLAAARTHRVTVRLQPTRGGATTRVATLRR